MYLRSYTGHINAPPPPPSFSDTLRCRLNCLSLYIMTLDIPISIFFLLFTDSNIIIFSSPDWCGVPVYSVFPPYLQFGMTTSISSRVRLTQTEGNRLVNRLKNTNLEKFRVLCKMHLCFLLHLPGSSLEEFLSDGGAAWSSAAVPQYPCTPGEKSKFRYFGKKKWSKGQYQVVWCVFVCFPTRLSS